MGPGLGPGEGGRHEHCHWLCQCACASELLKCEACRLLSTALSAAVCLGRLLFLLRTTVKVDLGLVCAGCGIHVPDDGLRERARGHCSEAACPK